MLNILKRQKKLDLACVLFEKNNGISVEKDSETLRERIIVNVVAEPVASIYADEVNNLGLD